MNAKLASNLSSDDIKVLRILRSSTKEHTLFMISNTISDNINKTEMILENLIALGLIQEVMQDGTDGFKYNYTYLIVDNKRSEVDDIVDKDYINSIIDFEPANYNNVCLDDRTFICLGCNTVYKSDFGMCKNCFETIVEIDAKIVDIIVELNRKGYKTMHCCSGHSSNLTSPAYISMGGIVDIETVPDGFVKEDRNSTIYRAISYYKRLNKKSSSLITKDDINKINEFINNDMNNLRKWVSKLPVKH